MPASCTSQHSSAVDVMNCRFSQRNFLFAVADTFEKWLCKRSFWIMALRSLRMASEAYQTFHGLQFWRPNHNVLKHRTFRRELTIRLLVCTIFNCKYLFNLILHCLKGFCVFNHGALWYRIVDRTRTILFWKSGWNVSYFFRLVWYNCDLCFGLRADYTGE